MIFNKEDRICIFTPPKNGTISLQNFLIGSRPLNFEGAPRIDENQKWFVVYDQMHGYPEILINRYPNLLEYKTFVFLRNPLARFESFVLYLKQKYKDRLQETFDKVGVTKSIEEFSYEDMIDLIDRLPGTFKIFTDPQTKWMQHPGTEILDFDNFASEVCCVTGKTGEVPQMNKSSDWGKSVITDRVRAFVREKYAVDYALAKDRLGKDYA